LKPPAAGSKPRQAGEQKVSGPEVESGKASKQQAGNINLGMVAPGRGSRYERAKGRCEKPTPDRKYQQAGLGALIRYCRKAAAGSKQANRTGILFAKLSAEVCRRGAKGDRAGPEGGLTGTKSD
jgi:hypothetical protein